jgi:hypothetical protein
VRELNLVSSAIDSYVSSVHSSISAACQDRVSHGPVYVSLWFRGAFARHAWLLVPVLYALRLQATPLITLGYALQYILQYNELSGGVPFNRTLSVRPNLVRSWLIATICCTSEYTALSFCYITARTIRAAVTRATINPAGRFLWQQLLLW